MPEEQNGHAPQGPPAESVEGQKGEADIPRIGVFVCHCGTNIGGYVDVPTVVEYVKTLPNVVHAEHNRYTCADDGLRAIKDGIEKYKLNRVVVASCTPRTHAPLFQSVCESAGLNKYLFTFVNIREHCSWVHMNDKEAATAKAKDLIRAGVARARLLQPQKEQRIPVIPVALIIGGGISGMTAALSLANQGFPVHLVEKEAELGGFIRNLSNLWMESGDPKTSVEPTIKKVLEHPKITTHLGSTVKLVDGHIGSFRITVNKGSKDEVVEAGVIIVAIGAEEFIPESMYGYEQFDNVVTLAELEILTKTDAFPKNLKDVAFIQCVGARGQLHSYCSRICCNVALKNAIYLSDRINEALIKKGAEVAKDALQAQEGQGAHPSVRIDVSKETVADELIKRRRSRRDRDKATEPGAPPSAPSADQRANITIFNRTVNAYGVHHEVYYNRAREKRIKFIKYDLENPPRVTSEEGRLVVHYYQQSLGEWRALKVDMVILATPLVAAGSTEQISKVLKVPRGRDGFFLEAHVKLRPVEFATEGIYLCGTCRAPADITESVLQANAAASRAAIPLKRGYVQVEALTSNVDAEKCVGCGTCECVCPYGAIEVKQTPQGFKAQVNVAACKGCGCCASVCPQRAIFMTHYSDQQILSEALAALMDTCQGVSQ